MDKVVIEGRFTTTWDVLKLFPVFQDEIFEGLNEIPWNWEIPDVDFPLADFEELCLIAQKYLQEERVCFRFGLLNVALFVGMEGDFFAYCCENTIRIDEEFDQVSLNSCLGFVRAYLETNKEAYLISTIDEMIPSSWCRRHFFPGSILNQFYPEIMIEPLIPGTPYVAETQREKRLYMIHNKGQDKRLFDEIILIFEQEYLFYTNNTPANTQWGNVILLKQ